MFSQSPHNQNKNLLTTNKKKKEKEKITHTIDIFNASIFWRKKKKEKKYLRHPSNFQTETYKFQKELAYKQSINNHTTKLKLYKVMFNVKASLHTPIVFIFLLT